MSTKFQALRGMDDILPGESEKWQWLEERARIFFESRAFKEIRTPVLEPAELFVRSVGEASDIVHKEMFRFEDRGGRQVALRPEMTASVARAVIEKGLLTQAKSHRLYYLGAMYRAERPQAGRKRQFHQIGIELINAAGPEADWECVTLLHGFFSSLGLKPLEFRANDLGRPEDQAAMLKQLQEYFREHKAKLCEDCHWRLEKNVLRIFDCKAKECQPVIEAAPWEDAAPLSKDFQKWISELKAHGVPVKIHRRLVRGLDYYNGAVFEVVAPGLGAQDAVAGGGRYDRLYETLGGPPAPSTGFSIGMERLLAVLEHSESESFRRALARRVYLAPLETEKKIQDFCGEIAFKFREEGIRPETAAGETSLSKHLKRANKLGLRFVVIVGASEFQSRKLILKDMQEKKQSEHGAEDLAARLVEVLPR